MLVLLSNILKFIISYIFGFVVNLRNYLYDVNWIKSISVDQQTNIKNSVAENERKNIIISIGNISVGGSGKTPLTIFLANEFSKIDYLVAVVGRGYGRKNTKNIIINKENTESIHLIKSDDIGDEMVEIAINTNADIFIGNKKSEMAKIASENIINTNSKYDFIIVDDGYQHRKLKRDFDIVIIDKNTLENENLMPLGRLREKYKSLRRANFIIFRNIDRKKLNQNQLVNLNYILSIITNHNIKFSHLNYSIGKLYNYNNIEKEMSFLSIGKANYNLNLITAIANPEVFVADVKNIGIEINKSFIYPDHYNFTTEDLRNIIEKTDSNSVFITTQKDYTKINIILEHLEQNEYLGVDNNLKNRFFYFKLEIKTGQSASNLINEILKLKSIV